MNNTISVLLGAVQGIAEFLPVSSTAHTMIFSQLFGGISENSAGQDAFYVFLNLGTLLALMIFFRRDIEKLFFGTFDLIFLKKTENRENVITLILASLPVIIIFGIIEILSLRSAMQFFGPQVTIGTMLFLFSIVMYICDQKSTEKTQVTRKDMILTGVAQLLSIIPGVSRLGICMSAMRYLGYSRLESFHASMILSIPPTAGACFLSFLKIFKNEIAVDWISVVIGCTTAFLLGLVTLKFVDWFLQKFTLLPLVIYRIVVGALVLIVSYVSCVG